MEFIFILFHTINNFCFLFIHRYLLHLTKGFFMKITISENLKELAELLKRHGSLYIVGGHIRNAILGFEGTDIDLTAKITPEKMVEYLKGTKFEIIEKSYKMGTVKIACENEIWDYTTFRKDNYSSGGMHRPQNVDFIEDLRQDAQRRDFTMNAIYYDILKEKTIDIYSGILDVKRHIIRCVETPSFVFSHDGLRILRMVRFASELGFKIDHTTLVTARKMAYQTNDISPFRKFTELNAVLNASKKYPISKKNAHLIGLNLYNELKLWNSHFVSASKVRLNMCKKLNVENLFLGLLIDIIDTICPPCVEYFINDFLGKEGFNLPPQTVKFYNLVICGYYDALNKMSNKKYFFKYYNVFEKVGEILQRKNKSLFSKYKFFYSYINKHKLPINIKELDISNDDLKKNFPTLPPKKYEIVLISLLNKVFDGIVKNEKSLLLNEIKNDLYNDVY